MPAYNGNATLKANVVSQVTAAETAGRWIQTLHRGIPGHASGDTDPNSGTPLGLMADGDWSWFRTALGIPEDLAMVFMAIYMGHPSFAVVPRAFFSTVQVGASAGQLSRIAFRTVRHALQKAVVDKVDDSRIATLMTKLGSDLDGWTSADAGKVAEKAALHLKARQFAARNDDLKYLCEMGWLTMRAAQEGSAAVRGRYLARAIVSACSVAPGNRAAVRAERARRYQAFGTELARLLAQ